MDREPLGDVTNRKIESPKEKQRRERDVGRKAVNSFKNYIGRLKEKQFSNFKLSVNANIRLIDRWTDQTIHYYSTANTEDTNQERYQKLTRDYFFGLLRWIIVWKVSAMCFCTAKKDLNQEIFRIPKWLKIVPVAEPTFLDKIIKMHKKGSSPEFSAIINLISHKVEKLIFQYFQGQKLLKTPKYQAGQK